jgi:hypothetical protein
MRFNDLWWRALASVAIALPISGLLAASSSPTPDLAQRETLVMTCSGTIDINGLDYAVTFSDEGGFSQVEFSRHGKAIATANLSFDGRNGADQTIWRGAVDGMADVVLIHLSDQVVQPGDEVSVGYDGQWGRGQCVES